MRIDGVDGHSYVLGGFTTGATEGREQSKEVEVLV